MGVALRLGAPNFSSLLHSSPSSSQRFSSTSSLRASSEPAAQWQLPALALSCRSKRAESVVRAADGAGVDLTTLLPFRSVQQQEEELRDSRVGQFCSLKEKAGKRTVGELEAEFLEALQSFYYEGKPIMSNEEFDNLKEELMWEGSKVVMLIHGGIFGLPSWQDDEYDTLKLKLKKFGSVVTMGGPRCSIRRRRVVSDSMVDYLKRTLLNAPAALIAVGLVFFLDDVTGFEITYLLELPEPYSFLFTWFIVLPTTFLIAQSLTNIVIKDAVILKGPCLNCGANTTSFFGTILTIDSGGPTNDVKCESCGSKLVYDILVYDINTRLIELDQSPPEPPTKKVAGKKAAAKSAS